jgi:hypothetical protein
MDTAAHRNRGEETVMDVPPVAPVDLFGVAVDGDETVSEYLGRLKEQLEAAIAGTCDKAKQTLRFWLSVSPVTRLSRSRA